MPNIISQKRFINEALEAHNKYRKLHGVQPLELDSKLTELALSWAENLSSEEKLRYKNHIYLNEPIGENILRYKLNKQYYIDGQQVTDIWYSEESDYKYKGEFTPTTGHFTQIIWKNTKKVGFGFGINEDGFMSVCAFYYPAGNYKNLFKENVFPIEKVKNNGKKVDQTSISKNKSIQNWMINVFTSNVKNAGTDADVHIVLYGTKGESEKLQLKGKKNNEKLFEKGQCDRFFETLPDIGKPIKIRIGHNNKGGFAGWHLDKVILENMDTREQYSFKCGRWLAKDELDNKIELELKVDDAFIEEPVNKNNSINTAAKKINSNENFGQRQAKFIEEALRKHNECRRKHGVDILEHNPELSKIAQDYAEKIAKMNLLKHSTNKYKGENLGENLSYYYDSHENYVYSGETATMQWYDEIKKHNFNMDHQPGTGHFTQLIWKTTKEVGFGVAKAADDSYYAVANYFPMGNIIGRFTQNVPRPL